MMKNKNSVFIIFALIFIIFYGCASRQTEVNQPDEEAVSNVRISANIPDDPATQRHGVGLVLVTIVFDAQTRQPILTLIPFFADFGDDTNTDVSEEMAASLRLFVEMINRNPNQQGIFIISFDTGNSEINDARALSIVTVLVLNGLNPDNILVRQLGQTRDDAQPTHINPPIEESQ